MICPLCQGKLAGEEEDSKEIFPDIPTLYRQFNLFFRILLFVSIVVAAVSLTVNLMIPRDSWWSLLVLAGIGGMWVAVSAAVRKRSNISKNILYQVVILSVLLAVIDLLTGWHGWSIDYVIPALCIFGILTIAVIAMIMYRRIEDYIIYVLINGVFGIVPVFLVIFGIADVAWPAVVSVLVSVLSISGMLLFTGIDVRTELKKRMHI